MNSLIGIKNQLVHKGIQHLHVSKQATKISEIRLHYLGYRHKTQWKKTYAHKIWAKKKSVLDDLNILSEIGWQQSPTISSHS